MLRELKDGHTGIASGNDEGAYPDFFLNEPPNFNRDLLERNYWRGDQRKTTNGLINVLMGDVGYIYYYSFQIPVESDALDFVLNRFQDTKGLIIDIRHNGGGDPNNGLRILERLISQRTHTYSAKYKNGKGRQDYTKNFKAHVEPDGNVRYEKPVIVLTNRLTYSAANMFAAQTKAFSNISLMGDTSGGGGGIPASYELPNGWAFRYSASIMSLPNGFIIENGIEPDFKVSMDEDQAKNGVDSILEEALSKLR
jgi:C-terminal processing protease CtpA/Prc